MMSETFVIDNNEVHSLYLNDRIPAEIAENLKEFFPEHGDLSFEEVLLQQESAYQYIQANGRNKDNTSNNGQTSNRSPAPVQGESSCSTSVESQLAMDEALARTLQELGEDFEDFYISEPSGTVAESREPTPRETPVRVSSHTATQDDIDPDNMTYEELQSLGESVGHESKGLSGDLISRLPTFKYKTGLFSKKRKKEEYALLLDLNNPSLLTIGNFSTLHTKVRCVICCLEYKGGARLTTLPCAHQYHSECIKRWLKLNKNCPVCQEEVREE